MRVIGPRASVVIGLAALTALGCSVSAGAGGVGGGYVGGGGEGGGEGGAGGTGGGGITIPLVAEAIATGTAHSCALLADGHVLCWGDGSHGQLGDGQATKDHLSLVPTEVLGITGATAIRAGGDTTCAIVGGSVLCWGDGAFGQLGDGVAKDGYLSATPVVAVGLSGVVDLSVTGTNVCGALADGTVACWGRNTLEGWLGFSSGDCGPYTVPSPDGPPKVLSVPCQPVPKAVPAAKHASAVVSGGAHNCLLDGGNVRCWGSDQFGQLGDGSFGPTAFQSDPVSVDGLADAKLLALGASHSCAVSGPEGRVLCWGDNAAGQLGIGTNTLDSYKVEATQIPGLEHVIHLSSTASTTCAVRLDGSVLCWGDTALVLPVSPAKGSALVPTLLPGLLGASTVRTGGAHACALLDDHSVICWGSNDRGQLGTGQPGLADFSLQPVLTPFDEPL